MKVSHRSPYWIISLFIAINVFGSESAKLDPVLRKQFSINNAEKVCDGTSESDHSYPILFEARDGFDSNLYDFSLRTVQSHYGTGRLSLSEIDILSIDPDIIRIDLAGTNKAALDESLPVIGADRIHTGSLGRSYLGSGVLISVYDSGIDWLHPDFIDGNTGQTRILMIWDQTIQDGPPPSGFGFGTLYTQDQIQSEIDGTSSGIVRSQDVWGHGTHVAGIAAGNGGSSSPYVGMAPHSELIVVKGNDYGTVTDDQVIDGVEFILRQAEALGRPVAINLSLGRQQGPHDGTSLFERMLDGFLWDPGQAIVVAVGNEGDEAIHISHEFIGESIDVQFTVPSNEAGATDYVLFEGWYPPDSNLEMTLEMPSGQMVGPAARGSIVRWPDAVHPLLYMDNANGGVDSQNGDRRIYMSLFDILSGDSLQEFESGTWTLHLTSDTGRLDLWLYDQTVGGEFLDHVDPNTTLSEPANARRLISVGSFVSRTEWPSQQAGVWGPGGLETGVLSDFSNRGPTRNNSAQSNPGGKPEITAPGEYVLSVLSSDIEESPGGYYISSDGAHLAWKGTSMSAPHVTGLIALMFEADPALTASDIKSLLIQSAKEDGHTGDTWNAAWGYGKLNAFEAMDLITRVEQRYNPSNIPDLALYPAYPNPFNGTVCISFAAGQASVTKLKIVNARGHLIRQWNTDNNKGVRTIAWDATDQSGAPVPTGVYLVVFATNNQSVTQKILYLK